jgi:hypothetical protein
MSDLELRCWWKTGQKQAKNGGDAPRAVLKGKANGSLGISCYPPNSRRLTRQDPEKFHEIPQFNSVFLNNPAPLQHPAPC